MTVTQRHYYRCWGTGIYTLLSLLRDEHYADTMLSAILALWLNNAWF